MCLGQLYFNLTLDSHFLSYGLVATNNGWLLAEKVCCSVSGFAREFDVVIPINRAAAVPIISSRHDALTICNFYKKQRSAGAATTTTEGNESRLRILLSPLAAGRLRRTLRELRTVKSEVE